MNQTIDKSLIIIKRNKIEFLLIGAFIIIAIIVVFTQAITKNNNSASKMPVIDAQPNSSTYVQEPSTDVLEFANHNKAAKVVIISITDNTVEVKFINNSKLSLELNSETKYKKGTSYETGSKDEITANKVVSLTYDPIDKIAKVLWYSNE